ncbi:Protein of unknown function [Lactobacillus helveticus CIRM-BIA 101]|nr:Protein of unknown function [Lactobacillus helveticus CIRM-BIA 101]
MFFFFQLN